MNIVKTGIFAGVLAFILLSGSLLLIVFDVPLRSYVRPCEEALGRQLLDSLLDDAKKWKIINYIHMQHESGSKLWIANSGYAMHFEPAGSLAWRKIGEVCGYKIYRATKPWRQELMGRKALSLQ